MLANHFFCSFFVCCSFTSLIKVFFYHNQILLWFIFLNAMKTSFVKVWVKITFILLIREKENEDLFVFEKNKYVHYKHFIYQLKNFIEMLISDIFSCFSCCWLEYLSNRFIRQGLSFILMISSKDKTIFDLIKSNEYLYMFFIIYWWNILFNLSWSNYCFNKRNRTNQWKWKSIWSTRSVWFSVS